MSVESQTASDKDTDGATLTAQVTATRGSQIVNPTSVGFRFGTSNTALNSTQTATLDENGNFTATLSGLAHSTTYYWVAYATVEGTEYTSQQRQFKTTTPTPEVTVTSKSYTELSDGYAPTADRAFLSADYTATLAGEGIAPTAVGFCYGTTNTRADAKSVTVEQANLTSGSGSFFLWQYDLQPDTKYYWWAWVEYNDKKYYTASSKQFTTKAAANTTPVVDETWLELPAAMDGTDYEGATVWTVKDGSTRNYTIAYDPSKYATYWVAYNLKASHMGSLERPSKWTYDYSTGAPETSKQVNVDNTYATYNGGDGHAKGHMIPNASRNGNATMQAQTFQYPNSVPQWHNGFNSGMWSSLENALQTIGKSEEIFIVTGTAFKKVGESKTIKYTSTPSDSGKSVPIPNYFYKVVLKVSKSGSTVTDAKAIGFWFDNKSYSNSTYSNYAVSVDQIEEWTGLNFFVNLSDTIEESAESNSSWSSFQSF